MLYWLAFLVLVIGASLGSQTLALLERSEAFQQQLSGLAVTDAGASIERYRRIEGVYPDSFSALASHSAGQSLRSFLTVSEGGVQPDNIRKTVFLETGSDIQDGYWEFDRIVAIGTHQRGQFGSLAEYTAAEANKCGTGPVASAADWCGADSRAWSRVEERAAALQEMVEERTAQIRILGKFISMLQGDGSFPPLGAPGATQSLYSLASAPSTFSTCASSIYRWGSLVLGCEDLFSRWGTPVIYHYRGEGNVAVMAQTPFKDNLGNPVWVATEMRL